MERTRILMLNFGVGDLAQSLRSVLDNAHSFGFEVREEWFSEDAVAEPNSRLFRVVAERPPDLAILCLSERQPHAQVAFDLTRKHLREVPIVIVAPAIEAEAWRELLTLGPDDFLTPPFRSVDVLPRLWRLCAGGSAADPIVQELKEKLGLKQLVGESPALLAEIEKIPPVARCDASVLITGETGTGKEMFARAVHHLSPRSAQAFNPINCGAIPVELVENELFGHEPGAFTSANAPAVGLLRETDGGSLFLDEVDCLPLLAQVKLLRFLQEKEFRPLGARKPCRVDVRVIAASNGDLEEAVAQGRFRRDLFYRLNVIGFSLPPLRERKEDIPFLSRHFLAKHGSALGVPGRELTASALHKLTLYDWPGNVRELENVIERSVVLCPRSLLRPEDIRLPIPAAVEERESFRALKAKTITQFERTYIQELLRTHHGNISQAARAAGKHRRAFWEMMRKHHIRVSARVRGQQAV